MQRISGSIGGWQVLHKAAAACTCGYSRPGECELTMASLDKLQLVLDWHHDMVRSGKKVGQTFNMDMIDAYYRQVADRGSPLLPFQERKLDKIIMSFHVNLWADKLSDVEGHRARSSHGGRFLSFCGVKGITNNTVTPWWNTCVHPCLSRLA